MYCELKLDMNSDTDFDHIKKLVTEPKEGKRLL